MKPTRSTAFHAFMKYIIQPYTQTHKHTHTHTVKHTAPLICLIWSAAAGPGLFCLPVRARAGCASVADPTPSRGHRPHWPTILRPTNPSKRTRGLSSSQWERERTNTAKSSTFHKKDIFWNGSSWLTIGLKVCVTAEQQDSKMAPYCELFLKSQDNCPFDNFLSSHRSLEEGQERRWTWAEVTETLGSHVTLCLKSNCCPLVWDCAQAQQHFPTAHAQRCDSRLSFFQGATNFNDYQSERQQSLVESQAWNNRVRNLVQKVIFSS